MTNCDNIKTYIRCLRMWRSRRCRRVTRIQRANVIEFWPISLHNLDETNLTNSPNTIELVFSISSAFVHRNYIIRSGKKMLHFGREKKIVSEFTRTIWWRRISQLRNSDSVELITTRRSGRDVPTFPLFGIKIYKILLQRLQNCMCRQHTCLKGNLIRCTNVFIHTVTQLQHKKHTPFLKQYLQK